MIFERFHREVVIHALVVGLEVRFFAGGEIANDVLRYARGDSLVDVRVPRVLGIPVTGGHQDAKLAELHGQRAIEAHVIADSGYFLEELRTVQPHVVRSGNVITSDDVLVVDLFLPRRELLIAQLWESHVVLPHVVGYRALSTLPQRRARGGDHRGHAIMALTPIRRVVTRNDAQGKSKVVWDGPSPGTHESNFTGRGHTDFWVWRETPPGLDGAEDAGTWDDEFPGPVGGGHLRVVHWLAKTEEAPPNEPYKAPEA